MKHDITSFVALSCFMCASANTETSDSLPAQELREIVIQAPKVIRKADKDVYLPSKSAVDNSQNGLQLLNNLMIPMVSVSDVLGTVKAAGQSVQIRINGRVSSVEQVSALLPETIKRVEWIDNPGLRYGGANYVLNFIVANPTVGGSLMTSARPALNQSWGLYLADIKLNNGRSQWHLRSKFKLTDKIKTHRDYYETFTFDDGSSLTRTETPKGGNMSNTTLRTWASYSYIKPDTTVFMAEFMLRNDFSEDTHYNGRLSLSDGSDDIMLSDSQGKYGNTPNLSLYWQQSLPGKQMLIVNFNSSFYIGRSFSDYLERLPDTPVYLTDIHTSIKDRNLAYAMGADYIKEWSNSRLSAGVSYTGNRNRSQYENLDGKIFHQRQDKVYIYSEYFRRLGKWSATVGMGVQYTDFLFKESDRGTNTWSPRPQATITYSLNQNHNFRLNFTSWQITPTLEETNIVPQQLDGFQWRVGNQALKTANTYQLNFRYGFSLPRVNGAFGISGLSSPNAITPFLYWDNDRLVTTFENSRGLRSITFSIAPQVEIIPDWLMANCYLQFSLERSQGTGYTHHNNTWSGNANIMLRHWGFVLSGQYNYGRRKLWGEKISYGESVNIISLSYKLKSWQFETGVFMPFGKYDMGSKSLNKWNRNEQHMRLNMRMPYITIAYNLRWGRQKRDVRRMVNIEAEADRSSAGSK